MAMNKVISSVLLAISISSVSMASQAALTLVNNTNRDSTSIINSGVCSSKLPNGITPAHTTNVVGDTVIKLACIKDKTNCTADVFMTRDCSGNRIARVSFNVNTSTVTSVAMNTSEYKISVDGLKITLDGGPALAGK
jgi:hypothetical protein